jgi:predicted peptidase
MKRYCYWFSLCLFAAVSSASAQRPSSGWQALYEAKHFEGMPYRLMQPHNFDPNEHYPVIISLHGAGGRGTDNRKQLKSWNQALAQQANRKNFPCYVLAPQSNSHWEIERFEQVKQIISTLPAVDIKRIYIMGHSMGGHGTFLWTQHDPDYFAAAAPCAGTGRRGRPEFVQPERLKDLPLWVFHGDRDKVCPYALAAKLLQDMRALGGNMKLTTWKGEGHGVSAKIIPGDKGDITELASDRSDPEPDFLTWLFKQRKR